MKVIKVGDEIMVLERVKKVGISESGSGAKSNPFRYTISIEYFGDECSDITVMHDKVKALEVMNRIYEILKGGG